MAKALANRYNISKTQVQNWKWNYSSQAQLYSSNMKRATKVIKGYKVEADYTESL